MSRAMYLFALVCACGPSSSPAPREPVPPAPVVAIDAAVGPDAPLDQDLARLAERATALYGEVAQAFDAAGADCARATAKLVELQTTYADVIAANAKVLHEDRARDLRAALEPHADKLDAAAKAIVESTTMSSCARDKAFTDAFDTLVGAPP